MIHPLCNLVIQPDGLPRISVWPKRRRQSRRRSRPRVMPGRAGPRRVERAARAASTPRHRRNSRKPGTLDALGLPRPMMLALRPPKTPCLEGGVSRRISSASGRGIAEPHRLGVVRERCITSLSWSRCGSGSGFHNMASQMLKWRWWRPMPSAMVTRGEREPGALRQRARAVADVLPEAHVYSGECMQRERTTGK